MHKRIGEPYRDFACSNFWCIDSPNFSAPFLITVNGIETLLIVRKIKPIQNRRIVCRENDLFVMLHGKGVQTPDKLGA